MDRRRFIIGLLSLPAAAAAARVVPKQFLTGGFIPKPKTLPLVGERFFLVSNPGHESWVRRRYLESSEMRSFKTQHVNVWMSNKEVEFIETRKFQLEEIYRIFNVGIQPKADSTNL
jgi:hypothetical protein